MYRVLFVCMGNICRSPAAEGVVRRMLDERGLSRLVSVDSAGTHGYHVGEAPDPRMRKAAARRSVNLNALRARQLVADDFRRFDRVLVMDRQNLAAASRISPAEQQKKLGLFLEYARDVGEQEVPDPYYGGPEGFERVLDLCEAAGAALVEVIARELASPGNKAG